MEQTKNPNLLVKRTDKNKITVNTNNIKSFLSKGLLFDLYILEEKEITGQIKKIPSVEIANLQLIKISNNSIFKVKKWLIKDKTIINKIKNNTNLEEMNAFIQLSHNDIAEKITTSHLEYILINNEV